MYFENVTILHNISAKTTLLNKIKYENGPINNSGQPFKIQRKKFSKLTQPTFTYSKSTNEATEQCVKSVQRGKYRHRATR